MANFVETEWIQDLYFQSKIDEQSIALDNTTMGNQHRGVGPKKLLLTALTGCTGMDVASIMHRKFKMPLESFKVSAKATLTDIHPRIYDTIHLVYTVKLDPDFQEKFHEAIEMSITTYCGVHAMLSKSSTITHEVIFL